MASLRQRIAIHEAAHVVVAARYGIPVSYAVIDSANPHMWYGPYRIPYPRLALKRMVRLCLAAGAAEEIYCGPSQHDGDDGDIVTARSYLATRYNDAAFIETELIRHRDAVARLVQRPWLRRRIKRVAAALLEHGRLTSDEIAALL